MANSMKKVRRFGLSLLAKIYVWYLEKSGYNVDNISLATEKRKQNSLKLYNSYYVYYW